MTSKKHRQFCLEPMGNKPVHDLPGIGPVLSGRLQSSGIRHARDIEGRFLVFNQNQEKFGNWLSDTCGANAKQQRDCYNGCVPIDLHYTTDRLQRFELKNLHLCSNEETKSPLGCPGGQDYIKPIEIQSSMDGKHLFTGVVYSIQGKRLDVTINATVDPQFTAMTTSKKHRRFCSEPMGDKLVYELPGIGPVLGGRLQNRGIIRARDILGRFLILNKDEWKFKNWLRDSCGANAKQQRDCYNCLREWTSNNL